MRKKILSVLLSVMMILNSLPLQVMAASFGSEPELPVEENVEQTEEEESSVSTVLAVSETVVPTVELPSNEELFEGYALKQFYGDVSFFGELARGQLNNVEQAIYGYLKTQIEAVAKSGGSTVFTVPDANLTVAGFVNSWTASELGFASVTEITEDVKAAISAKVQAQYNMDKILDALLTDCPFDLYWFEKASYGALQYGYSIGGTTAQLNVTNLTCYFLVADNYGSGNAMTSPVASKVASAVENAQAIVERYKGKSAEERLTAYKNEICNLVTYDTNAAENNTFSNDIDPWQLISVFDGDNSTNVVCEGYAKAFQYLCDLGGGLTCYSVSGTMSGGTGAGAHMWNIVELDGKSYLVDVTNSDSGTVGASGQLFLQVPASGDVANGYTFSTASQGGTTTFKYDAETTALWGTGASSILNLASIAYNATPVVSVTANSVTTEYASLEEAFAAVDSAVEGDNAVVTLLQDVSGLTESIKITSGVFTLDLNGKTLSGTCPEGTLYLINSAAVTVEDSGENGKINNDKDGVAALFVKDTAELTVNGGTVTGFCAVHSIDNASVTLNGGSFTGTATAAYNKPGADISIKGDATVTLGIGENGQGATFPNSFAISGSTTDALTLMKMLGTGAAYWRGGKMLTLTDDTVLRIDGGTVTIAPICTHPSEKLSYEKNKDGSTHSVTCSCGYTVKAENHSFGTSGTCACGAEAVLQSTINGEVAYYMTMEEAIAAVASAVESDNAVVTLLQDVSGLTESIKITSGVFTLDLNGHSITGTSSEDLLEIKGSVTLTITSSKEGGTLSASGSCLAVLEGSVTAKNIKLITKEYIHSTAAFTNGYLAYEKPKLKLENVVIEAGYLAVGAYGDGTTEIFGGSINGKNGDVDGAALLHEGVTFPEGISSVGDLKNFLADGMAYWQGDKMIVLTEGQTEITGGTVTVAPICTHPSEKLSYEDNEDGTHSVTCSCGYEVDEAHTPVYSAEGAVLSAQCGSCKAELGSLTLTAPEGLEYENEDKVVSVKGSIPNVVTPEVRYSGDRKNVTEEGFTASITLGDATASLNVKIQKTNLTWPRFTVESTSKVYDGTDVVHGGVKTLTYETKGGNTVITLPNEKHEATIRYATPDVGTKKTVVYIATTTDEELLKNYAVHYNGIVNNIVTDLSITARPITVTPETQVVEIGAAAPTTGKVSVSGEYGLVEGHSISVTLEAADTAALGAKALNIATVTILDKEGKDVTANYAITKQAGTLSVIEHVHQWTAAADDDANTITLTCQKDNCPIVNKTVVYTLTAPTDAVYDGSTHGAIVTVVPENEHNSYTLQNASDMISAGEKTATLTVEGQSVSIDYSVAKQKLTIRVKDQSLTYGQPFAADLNMLEVTSGSLVSGDVLAAVTIETEGSAVGTYSLTASGLMISKEGKDVQGNYDITYAAGTLTITAKALTDPTISGVEASYTYSGSPIQPAVSVKDGDTELVLNRDYTVTYGNNTTVAQGGSVTVAFQGNYSGEKTLTFAIEKAVPSYNAPNDLTATYGQQMLEVELPSGWVWVKQYDLVGTVGTHSHEAVFTPSDRENYNSVTVPLSVKVEKAMPGHGEGYEIPDSLTATYGQTLSEVALPSGWTWDEPNALVGLFGMQEHKATFTPSDTENYKTVSLEMRIQVAKATLTAEDYTAPTAKDLTYSNEEVELISAGSVKVEGLTFLYSVDGGNTWSEEIPTRKNAGSCTVKWKLSGNNNYIEVGGELSAGIKKKVLGWYSGDLSASKAAGETGETPVYGSLSVIGLAPNDSIGFNGGLMQTKGLAAVTAPGTYTVQVVPVGQWTLEGASAQNYELPNEYPSISAVINPVVENQWTPDADESNVLYKAVIEDGVSLVPAGLLYRPYRNPAEVEAKMLEAVVQQNSSIVENNTAVYDVTLLVCKDGGTSWNKLIAADFPAEGIEIRLPYPEGSDASYQFYAAHMFTEAENGHAVGELEYPSVSRDESGIRMVLGGLSPVAVAWVETSGEGTPPTVAPEVEIEKEYRVKVEKTENGDVDASHRYAVRGEKVTLSVEADKGFQLEELTVRTAKGKAVKVTVEGNGEYSFRMPDSAVTVEASFIRPVVEKENPNTGALLPMGGAQPLEMAALAAAAWLLRKHR